jgi:hypothetical protein
LEEDAHADSAEVLDLAYWEKRSNPQSMAIVKKLIDMLPEGSRRVTYNRDYIALSTTGSQIAWLEPRAVGPQCLVRTAKRMDEADATKWVTTLNDKGIAAKSRKWYMAMTLNEQELKDHEDTIRVFLSECEQVSRKDI